MEISLSPASLSDIPLIAQLAEKIWRVHYTPIIGEQQVEYMLVKMYSAKSLEEQMKDGHLFFIVVKNSDPIGYLSLSKKGEGEYFLHKFYINPGEQGKGNGKKVFQNLLEKFPGLQTLRLTVNRKNFKSVNFYFRAGFTIEDAKDFDIGKGFFMEDFVMIYSRK